MEESLISYHEKNRYMGCSWQQNSTTWDGNVPMMYSTKPKELITQMMNHAFYATYLKIKYENYYLMNYIEHTKLMK